MLTGWKNLFHFIHFNEYYSRDVEGLADSEDAVLDAEVDEAVPPAPQDGVVHYRRLK